MTTWLPHFLCFGNWKQQLLSVAGSTQAINFTRAKIYGPTLFGHFPEKHQLGINKIFIQAKRYAENKVRKKYIRNFIGAMSGDTINGVFVTTSTFDDAAVVKAREAHHKIILIDGFKLTQLMFEFGVGVQTTNTYDMKEVDEDFFEASQ